MFLSLDEIVTTKEAKKKSILEEEEDEPNPPGSTGNKSGHTLETPPAIHCKVSDRSDKTDEFYVCKSRWKNCLGNVSNVRDKRTKMGLSFSVLLVTRGSYDRDTLLLDLYANLINA